MKLLDKIIFNVVLFAGYLSFVEGRKAHNNSARVIGGYLTNIDHFPYMVSIQSYQNGWVHNCGGSIISQWSVLTACHCLANSVTSRPVYKNPQYHRIVAGVTNLRYAQHGQVIRAERFEVHPNCGGPQYHNDAGVIVLQRPFQWSYTVQPISFYSTNRDEAKRHLFDMEASQTPCYSPGWGTTIGSGHSPSSQLKVTPATLLSSQQCANAFCQLVKNNCDTDFYSVHQVCASSGSGIVCNGDSGGPLVCNGHVVGVVSWKWRCIIGWPHVYSDIAPLLDVAYKYLQ